MLNLDLPKLYRELASNPYTKAHILADSQLGLDAFVTRRHQALRAHYAQAGEDMAVEDARATAAALWGYIQYFRRMLSVPSSNLRQQAEAQLRDMDAPGMATCTPEATQQLVHELRVHQIQLEMQNEELRRTQEVLDIERARYFDLYDLAPVGYVTLSETGVIEEVNLAATTLLNVHRDYLGSQLLTDFILPEDQDVFYHCRQQLWSTGEPQACEVRLRRQDKTPCWIHLETRLVPAGEGETPQWRTILSDITQRKQDEQQLQAALEEKSLLLKELHHRVKNNLNVVVSLLGLQANQIQHPATQDALRDVRARIYSMALVHDTLHQRGTMGGVDGALYLSQLCDRISQSFGLMSGRVHLSHRLTSVQLTLDQATTCGLIVNELVSNAFKHAFPGDRSGQILVVLAVAEDGRRVLVVSDDGVGLPPDWQNRESLGLKLVPGLARQLGGELELQGHAGTLFSLTFPASCPQA